MSAGGDCQCVDDMWHHETKRGQKSQVRDGVAVTGRGLARRWGNSTWS